MKSTSSGTGNLLCILFKIGEEKKHIFFNPKNLGMRIWREKKPDKKNKKNTAKLQKSQILPKSILFLPFDRCFMILPKYLHSIYMVYTIYLVGR